jgi:hypothetical protein
VPRFVRTAPATYVYLFTLCVTTWVLQTSSAPVARRLLLEESTSLDRLEHEPVRVLVASAFWLSQSWQLLAWAVLFTIVLAPAERYLGSRRWILTFAAGHVGATLVTAAVLWLAIHDRWVEARLGRVQDVGASYGFFAVAAALTFAFAGRRRLLYTALLWLAVAVGALLTEGTTTLGHAAAIGLGYLCWLAYGRRGSWPSAHSAAIPARGSPSRPS